MTSDEFKAHQDKVLEDERARRHMIEALLRDLQDIETGRQRDVTDLAVACYDNAIAPDEVGPRMKAIHDRWNEKHQSVVTTLQGLMP